MWSQSVGRTERISLSLADLVVQVKGIRKKHFVTTSIRIKRGMWQMDRSIKNSGGSQKVGNPVKWQLYLYFFLGQHILIFFNTKNSILYLALYDFSLTDTLKYQLPSSQTPWEGWSKERSGVFSKVLIPRYPFSPFLLNAQPQGPPAAAFGRQFSWEPRKPLAELLLNPILPKVTQQRRGDLPQCPDIFHGSF